jgi:hypothetical protein
MEMSGQPYASATICWAKESPVFWIGDWVIPRANVDILKKRKISCPVRI